MKCNRAARLLLLFALAAAFGCACGDRPRLFDRFRRADIIDCCPVVDPCCEVVEGIAPCDTCEGPFLGVPGVAPPPLEPPNVLPMPTPGVIPPAGVQESPPAQPFPADSSGLRVRPLGKTVNTVTPGEAK